MNRRPRRRPRPPGKPVIGLTCEVQKQKPYFAEFELLCDYRYVRSIVRAGGVPVLLPVNPFGRDVGCMLTGIAGVVIVGGDDIPPSFYGEQMSEKVEPMYRGRTYFEMDLYRAACRRKLPVLAICHGMQLLNVIQGGTLHRDIPSELADVADHRSPDVPLHRVRVTAGSVIHRIARRREFDVFSDHHQAIKQLGRGLQVTALSADGVIEAVEGPPRVLAVQWHPERQPRDPIQRRLFRYFVQSCRCRAR